MKHLYLMRHSQAESAGPAGDASRPLTPEGFRAAEQVGADLRDRGIQLALVSSAVRTRQTFEALGLDCRAEFMDALYDASPDTIAQRIGEVDEDVSELLVVAHSPAIPSLASQLLWTTDRELADKVRCSYPTSSVTEIEVDRPWAEVTA